MKEENIVDVDPPVQSGLGKQSVEKELSNSLDKEDLTRIFIEGLDKMVEQQENIILEIGNVKCVLDVMSKALDRMVSSFRRAESVTSQVEPRRLHDSRSLGSQHGETYPQRQYGDDGKYKFQWRKSDYPNVDEYAWWNTAHENVRRMAEDRVTIDGWRYWISRNGKYIYRKKVY